MTRRVAILHPWFPQYRKPFFERLVCLLKEEDVEVDIFHGPPPPEWGARGDAVTADYATLLPTRFLTMKGVSLAIKDVSIIRKSGPYDLIILEQAVRNIESYSLMLRPAAYRLAFWGHGRTYTKQVSKFQEYLKTRLTNKAQWFFGYTVAGRDAVVRKGFPRGNTTVVANSTDTAALIRGLDAVETADIRRVRDMFDLRGRTAVFVGGLDSAKRIPFLLSAAHMIHAVDPDFRLVIAGDGSDRHVVESATATNPAVKYAGPLFGADKYALLASAQVMAMPGRVGLVAVDSLAAGIPIVTTDWQWHAPEFDYLENGITCLVTPDNVEVFAFELRELLANPSRVDELATACRSRASSYSIEAMASNFAQGVLECLSRPLPQR